MSVSRKAEKKKEQVKGPGVGMCLVCWEKSEEDSVATAEGASGGWEG